jgi:hypothetical protein
VRAPLIASYFTYYVIKPQSRNNYGALIDPRQYPIPPGQHHRRQAGQAGGLQGQVDHAEGRSRATVGALPKKLFAMRQLR